MSRGSEQFTRKAYEGLPRQCGRCLRAVRLADVARVHTGCDYASGIGVARTVFLCNDCEGRP